MVYEVGNQRSDAKFNVWRKVILGDYIHDWMIVKVFEDLPSATSWAKMKNENKSKRYKSS